MNKFIILLIFGASICSASIESIFIKGISFMEKDDGYMVTCYSGTDPWIIISERFIPVRKVDFLKTATPPIWITFKDGQISTILTSGKKVRGSNLKEEEKNKILKFRQFLEDTID